MEVGSCSVQIVQEADIDGNLLRAADSSVAGGVFISRILTEL